MAALMEETELVGQSKPKNDLIELITENNAHKKFIWVTGMGGLGKTTLIKKVYDNQKIRKHFTCTAWITVSQNFDLVNILINIVNQISSDRDATTKRGEELVNYVKSQLKENYLVVLDDLWTIPDWKTLENVFPNNKDSCVMVTTRNVDVAQYCSWEFKCIYPLVPLSDQDSHDLFLRKLNNSNDQFDPNNSLKDVIGKIIKKCRGLPLALVTIGGLLASKPIDKEEWEKVINRLGSELETNPSAEPINQILDLSYIDLPYHLKPCLLYLSIFPEDYEIKRSTLVYRWMAEGFVRQRRGMTLEEVAEEYFYELINRSLIQPSEVGVDGRIKSCRVHDIMRELIVAKSIDENLIFVAGGSGSGSGGKEGNIALANNFRHLVVLPNSKEVVGANQPSIRSVSIFDGPIPDLLSSPDSKSKLLRVLDIKSMSKYYFYHASNDDKYRQFIKQMQQFVHLKYIWIQRNDRQLVKSIGNFRNLQTLQLFSWERVTSQINITKLQQLRHFFIDNKTLRGK